MMPPPGTPRRILLAGWVVFLLYAYPGYMQLDGADMLFDSRSGAFTDWNSPVMTQLWRIVGLVIDGPAGMLFVQSVLLLVGCYQLARRVVSERAAAIVAIVVLLAPPAIATTALVSAEGQLAAFLVAGLAALGSERRRIRLGGLASIAIACGMRHGAALAALPIVVGYFHWGAETRWRPRGLAIGAWLACVLAMLGLEHLLIDVRTQRNETALAMSDIVGTVCRARLSDTELREVMSDAPLARTPGLQPRACAIEGETRRYDHGEQRIFESIETADHRAGVIAARNALAYAAPGAYLAYRGKRFLHTLGVLSRPGFHAAFLQSPATGETLGFEASHSTLQRGLVAPVRWLNATPLMRPYLYAALALVLLVIAVRRRDRLVATLCSSAVIYELSLFFVAERPNLRDSHWLIAATVLALAIVVAGRRGKTQE
jgi:hypothetical protein